MNSIGDPLSRKESVKTAIPTRALREARKAHIKAISDDPRWKALKPIDRRHMRQLLWWHNPLTGHLKYRTPAKNLAAELDVTEETVRTSRWRLIEAGLIVSYVPGSGHRASEYVVARSWEEAEAAAALRKAPEAPHWPELVTRTPSAVGKRDASAVGKRDASAAAGAVEDQKDVAAEDTAEERAQAQERYERARRRRGVVGPVPPELPDSQDADWRRDVIQLRTDVESQVQRDARGGAAARAALKRRTRSATGAA